MKKIGIMSMQRIVNYGSFLQAYGLKKAIEKLGYKVEFVDYEFEKSVIGKPKNNFLKRITNNINIKEHKKKIEHKNLFIREYEKYIKKYLKIDDKKNYYPKIDTLVIGSDEVFNCLQYYPVGYSRNLFGFGYDNVKKISYAASFGHTTIEGLKKYNIDKDIARLLLNFDAISVRDNNSQKVIKELINKNVQINCDPVIIGDYDKEIKKEKVLEKDYIVIYAYSGRLSNKEEKAIKRFARNHNKKIISLGFYQRIADINLVVNPFLVLKYIKCADYVITDTFHGTVFSIKMNTKFCTIIRNSNYNKLYSLLDKFSLTEQIVKDINDIERIYNKKVNFKECNKKIDEETHNTIMFLKNNL